MAPSVALSRGSVKGLALEGRRTVSPEGRFHCTEGLCCETYLDVSLPHIPLRESGYHHLHDLGQVPSFPEEACFLSYNIKD